MNEIAPQRGLQDHGYFQARRQSRARVLQRKCWLVQRPLTAEPGVVSLENCALIYLCHRRRRSSIVGAASAHCRHNRVNSIGLLIATQTRVPQLAHDAR